MSTFDYLKPGEALHLASDQARDFEKITGLKAVSANRLEPRVYWLTRTRAGYMRKPDEGWHAHNHMDQFKELSRVERAKNAEPGMVEVFYADGTTDLVGEHDLLCVERPVMKD